jgi:cation-transporting ATPase 13A2
MNLGQIRRCFGRTAGKVGMVGDGANDILAIREADVGIGISETDSSFAANFAIGCVMDVEAILREGKSTLTIIMEIFRYYISISILKYTACMIMAVDKSNYSDNQFTYFNYVQTLEIVVFLCLSHPASKLSEWIPNDNFMSL